MDSWTQYNTTQYNTVQYNTMPYKTIGWDTTTVKTNYCGPLSGVNVRAAFLLDYFKILSRGPTSITTPHVLLLSWKCGCVLHAKTHSPVYFIIITYLELGHRRKILKTNILRLT